MKIISKILFSLFLILTSVNLFSQTVVPKSKMEEVYEEIKTPYKFGMVIAPETNDKKADCPTIFRKGDKWFMTYFIFNGKSGRDGRGYETWLAESDNLLDWKTLGKVLSFNDGEWDENQRGGYLSLIDNTWGGGYGIEKFKNRYWMSYIGGNKTGYETAPLSIGIAYTKKDPTTAHEWQSFKKPALAHDDKDGQWFDNVILYKSSVFRDETNKFGKPFVMFYNAGGINPENNIKAERIGMAFSDDMIHWKRYENNPVVSHEEGITGDAYIQKMGDLYVMFYFGAFHKSRSYKAYNTFACSYDLINWTDWEGEDLIIPSKDYDDMFAHKSCVVKHEGVVYHFYCAVNKDDQRGIALAVSKPMGRSKINFPEPEPKGKRTVVSLNKDWHTISAGENSNQYDDFNVDSDWMRVNVPHNWDDYYGYRQLVHGNKHGNAWYNKEFHLPEYDNDKRIYLNFEGVGTYATVFVNGHNMGRHLSGRTTLSIDVTDVIRMNAQNTISVKVEHPSLITDMPWVCGGCSSEWGFSEGSQPMGIFRPVTLEVIDKVRVEPFGVHIWNNDAKNLNIETEIKNYGNTTETIEFVTRLNDDDGIAVFRLTDTLTLAPGETKVVKQISPELKNPRLWSNEDPYLYKLASVIKRNGTTTDETTTPYGIRTISWPLKRNDGDNTFRLNGKSVFLNGVSEYEHIFGQSHAFSDDEIKARVRQIKDAGFNSFRDGHQPHNLRYQKYWDENGILFWPQFSAHIWYDTPEFRENFKVLLRKWIKERRNSPSVIMWGLQNESVLPKEFAEECSEIIREMDPTARGQRIVTTCNGGSGTDWNVVQNWSGTYGGNPNNYANEIKTQLMNGEYGAWRSIDLHSEGEFDQDGVWSEDRMTLLVEQKVRLAESVRDHVCGQYQWIFNSHDNPGRKHPDEGYRIIDKIGPVNYKGLQTSWGEPLDVYYMYRSNYVDARKDPMVYIVSHTWPDRWTNGGVKDGIRVFSNCDEVELFNDVKSESLGKLKKGGVGTHFIWNNVDIKYNVLYAVGYVDGKPVADDYIVLENLPKAPNFDNLYKDLKPILKADEQYNYIYRVNCGGDEFMDEFGQTWETDIALSENKTWGSFSWADDFEDINPYQASQRVTYDPIKGTKDWELFGHYRFGRHKLGYHFPVPDGEYRIELFFTEPWHGTGGNKDCEGYRLFDVAVNDSVVLKNVDIWAEVGHDAAFKQVLYAKAKNGELKITFPEIKAGQAVVSAIAIASKDFGLQPQKAVNPNNWSWKNIENVVKTPPESLPEGGETRVATTYPAVDADVKGRFIKEEIRKKTSVSLSDPKSNSISWEISTGVANVYALRFDYMNMNSTSREVHLRLYQKDGTVVLDDVITFPSVNEKWRVLNTSTRGFINAGDYKIELSADDMKGIRIHALTVQ